MKRDILSSIYLVSLLTSGTVALNNGLGLKPAMGWNAWNSIGCDITEAKFTANVDKIIALGLADLGYTYANLDDCWQLADRDKDGHVQVNTTAFPNGMASLATYVHSKNMSFGIYSSAGLKTCQGRAGSLNNEAIDAADYAAWGVDYLKYDNCDNQFVPATQRYGAMRDALMKQNRSIYYSICNWGEEEVWQWGNQTGNSWRTSGDISNFFAKMKYNFIRASQHPESAGPGSWNDPDMLEVGNGGMTIAEQKTHFALWCFIRAPLLLGNDFSNTAPEALAILSNPRLIAINQDSLGKQAVCTMNCDSDVQVYQSYQADNGTYWALLIVNWNDDQVKSLILDLVLLGVSPAPYYNCLLTDLWTGTTVGTFNRQYLARNIQPHDNIALRVECTLPSNLELIQDEVVEEVFIGFQ